MRWEERKEMLRESYILVYKVLVIGLIAVGYIRVNRTWRKCVFDENKAIVNLEHHLGLALSTI